MKIPTVRVTLCTTGLLVFFLYMLSISSTKDDPLPGWEKNVSRNASHYLRGKRFTILPKNFCDQPSLLLMITCSSANNFEARDAVRETWGQAQVVLGQNVTMYFLVGETSSFTTKQRLKIESTIYGDIIQGNFLDTYHNLTLKSVFMLNLVSEHCRESTKFLLKIDDDMLLNVEKLIRVLKEMENAKNVLMGKLLCGARPIRNPTSKWYTPKYMYDKSVFPNYLSGTSYLMSLDVAQKLSEMALSTPLLHLEDVYLTGICAKKARIVPRNSMYFTHHYLDQKLCEYHRYITMHHFNPESLLSSYQIMTDPKIEEECSKIKPVFSAHKWVLNNILKPNRLYRKYVLCM